ncbi:MAG TPA: hypothetical protein VGE97_04980, partial [Nitrososphaera sp.]
YSNKGRGSLYEAVILAGRTAFLRYQNGAIEKIDSIVEDGVRLIKPPHLEHYPYEPYAFENMNEVFRYLDIAKNETIDSLYRQSKQIASSYNDQSKYKIQLLAINIIWVYFQDRFPTTHYDIILGSPGSGKSSYGETFTAVGYRVVNLTDPNAANINRILGVIEPGQCTIVSDETGQIDKHPDLMSILKTGYSIKGKTSKINDNSRQPEFFSTFCYKMIIAERMPNLRDTRGVYDRAFSFTAFKGRPKYDIKETLEPQGNPARQERLDTLNDFRKLMLIYRLLRFNDPICDIDVGVEGRDKELSKPILQLFYGSKVQKEVEETLQFWLDQRNERKETSLESILHPIVKELVSQVITGEVYVKHIWNRMTDASTGELSGSYDPKKPNEFQSHDFGTIYRNQIGTILEHTFGGTPKHRRFGNSYIFDPEELDRVGKTYNIKTKIDTKSVSEGSEGSEGSIEASYAKNQANNKENERDLRSKTGPKEADKENLPPAEPSPSSPFSPSSPQAEDITKESLLRQVKESIYQLKNSVLWGCKNCQVRGDQWHMENHYCEILKKQQKEAAGKM